MKTLSLIAALFCERVERGVDAISFVNVHHAVTPTQDDELETVWATLAVYLFVVEPTPPTTIEIRAAAAMNFPPVREPIAFGDEGEVSLATFLIPMRPPSPGTYWFEVLLGGEPLARVPFAFRG